MDNTLLINLSYQLAAYRSMDVIANNIANVSTPAFKRESMKFEEYVDNPPVVEGEDKPEAMSFVQDAGIGRDLREGPVEKTGAPFDLAINGPGYFTVKNANGTDRYTRNGHFTLDSQGRIATQDGDLLQGDGGEITVTSDDGDIHIADDGTVTGIKGQLGKVKLASFDNEAALKKEGTSLYSTDQQAKPIEKANMKQGALESSNVSAVVEISHMLEIMRAYQATANLAQSQQQLMQQAIDKLGQVES
ncbi:MAG TPA: flagellar basal-body rod protein FlgF [Rhizomicrobium sp.]|jgi:flagellar basal-body rod protein FlgF